MVQPGAVAVAHEDEGAGTRVEHEGKILGPHHRRHVGVDAVRAGDLPRDGRREGGLPRMISPTRRSRRSRVSGRKLRAVPPSFAVCGMTLSVLPAWNVEIETTAESTGSTLRDTIVWIWLTMCAPITIGSTTRCGRAAWPPTPSMRIVMRSAAAMIGPWRMANWPTGRPGKLCMP